MPFFLAVWCRAAPSNRAFALALAALIAIFAAPLAVLSHEGHDHGPPPPPLPKVSKPRIAVHSDTYELVAIASGERLVLFLDRYADNVPVPDARIEVLAGAATVVAEPQGDSTYVAVITGLANVGRHPLVFTIAHGGGDDLLEGTLDVGQPGATDKPAGGVASAPSSAVASGSTVRWLGIVALSALATFVAGIALGRRFRVSAPLVAIMAFSFVWLAGSSRGIAHEGHPPSPAPSAASLLGDVPRRLGDGSVFLPKPSQRLLTIRTQLAAEGEANRTASFVGRLVSDPNRAGIVQSVGGGRVVAPAGGFPHLGQVVRAGQVLATVMPALPLADQSTLAEKARELEGQVVLGEQRLARLTRLTQGNVPKSQIDDVELEVANTRRRLEILREIRIQPEMLTAPVDGVISLVRVVAGQVVQAQDVLFQMVDPNGFWVEALAFDQMVAGGIRSATAILGDGQRIALTFVGQGRALQQQAALLHFSIAKPPANAVLGAPVTVIARKTETLKGMLLPRDALIRGSGGEQMVWQHVDPERFVARQVRIEPFDGEQVLVTAGIAPRDRIVVHGAELLAQVR